MSNFKSEFNKLNDNLKRNIYEYDPTFRNIFKNVLLELKTKHYKELINIRFNIPDFIFLDGFKVETTDPIHNIKIITAELYRMFKSVTLELDKINIYYKRQLLKYKNNFNTYGISNNSNLIVRRRKDNTIYIYKLR